MLTLEELTELTGRGEIDTVVVAFTDMQGRLMGKRLHAEFFLDQHAAGAAVEGCNYLLALEMEMDPVPGYAIASWEQGYGDFDVVPDLATLRRIPWLEGTALVLGDVLWHDHTPVQPSPRQVLRAQMERAAALGFTPMMGSELEFYLVKETYAEAHADGYRTLTPSVPYVLDYHILGTTYDEPFLRAVRNHMQAAGMRVETSKGEAWPGQQEINFRFADALTMADNHVDLQERRQGDRVPARLRDHVHGEAVRGLDRQLVPRPLVAVPRRRAGVRRRRDALPRWLAGQIACFEELAVFLAPTINSYKRFAAGSWAPTTLAWGNDNRTCGFRVVGTGRRAPRGDADPGRRREPVPRLRGDHRGGPARDRARARAARAARRATPTSRTRSASRRRCATAIALLESGTMARGAFGDQVVDHYLNYARTEQAIFDRFVTDWERRRYFERI